MTELRKLMKENLAMRRQLAEIKHIAKEEKKLAKLTLKKCVQMEYLESLYREYEKRYSEDLRKLGKKYERV